ncbi:DUF445 domain-containing protein [Novosphingobium sp. KCTC 2891]|uniref:DUF445 domain-containing protein n=1 Tax=Novosphingobium sp. KCTC 2891 TaxID=2989730 RepID=UPI002222C1BA|nr:DUF445 domain-containing protein [Novosphingobium sp. KCTC 2891]MCW1382347.1 DUF445 domain-containing protein [Novosphingobium sp. KCTC 2891]
MRLIATGLLVAMAGTFFLARHFETADPAWGYLRAFAEAAMVGGLADWFAVTALFRHPLGLPIPHTAIIPENKDRIADTMATFLQDNFLTPQVVARRLQALNAATLAGQFLANPRGSESRLRDGATSLVADVLESLDQEKLGGIAKGALRGQIEKLDLAPLLGQLLGAMIADGRHMPLIESLIRKTAHTLEANEDMIRAMIHERANALVRFARLDERLANTILDGLYKLLAETVVMPDHPLRVKIEDGLNQLAHDLVHDPEMRARVERMKGEVLANPAFAGWLDALWERGRARLLKAVREPEGVLSGQIGDSLGELGRALQHDARLQVLVNRFARRTLVGVASRYGGQIVRLVSETVRRWDARTVTDRIEGAVGRDLQFIRINGTVVGGLVGVAIHAVDVLL